MQLFTALFKSSTSDNKTYQRSIFSSFLIFSLWPTDPINSISHFLFQGIMWRFTVKPIDRLFYRWIIQAGEAWLFIVTIHLGHNLFIGFDSWWVSIYVSMYKPIKGCTNTCVCTYPRDVSGFSFNLSFFRTLFLATFYPFRVSRTRYKAASRKEPEKEFKKRVKKRLDIARAGPFTEPGRRGIVREASEPQTNGSRPRISRAVSRRMSFLLFTPAFSPISSHLAPFHVPFLTL